MDIDEQHTRLCLSLAGAHRLLAEAQESLDARAIDEAELDVKLAEEALAWFEHQNGMEK
jgi:hypothetical protein